MVDTLPKFDPTGDSSLAIALALNKRPSGAALKAAPHAPEEECRSRQSSSAASFQFGGYVSLHNTSSEKAPSMPMSSPLDVGDATTMERNEAGNRTKPF